MTPQQIWQAVLAELELSLSRANFVTWFKNTSIGCFENNDMIVCVPSSFYQTYLEKKFHATLIKLVEKITGESLRSLTYRVETFRQNSLPNPRASSRNEKEEIAQILPVAVPETVNAFGLNPRYLFENFIVGKGSELAHAASQAVATQPGRAYNPLFIYGGSGLGKTHLLQAIGNAILRQNKQKKIVCTSCEKFTNEFIHSLRVKQIENFHHTYRRADVLLMDDIQFISGKTETQEAFFNTFNELHQQDKQIVITADRPPKAIAHLESRLLTRFEMGMLADVSPPDLETRLAILEAKCQEKNLPLEKESLNLIAAAIQNNVRELEGALNKLHAYFQLKKLTPDLELVRSLISHLENSASRRVLTAKHILQTVSEFFDLKIDELLGKSREKRLAYPRQIVMYLLRFELGASYPTIGHELGNRDHTTAMHACQKIKGIVEKDHKIREEISQIRQRLFAV